MTRKLKEEKIKKCLRCIHNLEIKGCVTKDYEYINSNNKPSNGYSTKESERKAVVIQKYN